ncbi:hypothetical protein [Sphingobium sp. CAP-1]|uniref:hypothetical protein n=1 Tax=Sphingobium sp. CAP-1 TaxID=2676077 RepID=UPI0012BB33B3|nr:hypothetical protein [Sphingobium sp. CAP-1]QGP77589.1 hypothetical protein GL174_00225 [Sphingobium sp. CAP-1]
MNTPAMASRLMLDFMTMDVCVDAHDQIQRNLIPGDSRCNRRRDIGADETPPYNLHNYGYPGTPCGSLGTIDKTNMPVIRNGVTRIVSTTVRRPGCSARTKSADLAGDATAQDGASIQWADDGYGFIMGSYSPVSLSAFQSSLCRDNPRSSRRFFRSWVIAPSPLPVVGSGGVGMFDGAMAKGASRTMMDNCPTRFRRALTAWTVQPFLFKSDRRLIAVISSHFAQGTPDGLSPGQSMQMERTYWTSEFGISRWEKWTREDYARKDGKDVATTARLLVQRGRCSAPNITSVTYSTGLRESGAPDSDSYVRILTNPKTGERHRWLMTLCEDYSNARIDTPDNRRVPPSALASDLYWAQ